ncbi:hypothetical protein GCM10018955_27080 [Planomonospora venezuelensis]
MLWPCPGISPHPITPRPGARQLRWNATAPGDVRRVLEHTCPCRSTTYELCALGGHRVIRRTVRHLDAIHYAGPWPQRETEVWWISLLMGQAR